MSRGSNCSVNLTPKSLVFSTLDYKRKRAFLEHRAGETRKLASSEVQLGDPVRTKGNLVLNVQLSPGAVVLGGADAGVYEGYGYEAIVDAGVV